MGKWLEKLNGLKSAAGFAMIAAYYAAPQFGQKVPEVVLTVGTGLAGVGIAHKLEKGVGLVSKGLDITIKILDVTKKVLEALKAKEATEEKK